MGRLSTFDVVSIFRIDLIGGFGLIWVSWVGVRMGGFWALDLLGLGLGLGFGVWVWPLDLGFGIWIGRLDVPWRSDLVWFFFFSPFFLGGGSGDLG